MTERRGGVVLLAVRGVCVYPMWSALCCFQLEGLQRKTLLGKEGIFWFSPLINIDQLEAEG